MPCYEHAYLLPRLGVVLGASTARVVPTTGRSATIASSPFLARRACIDDVPALSFRTGWAARHHRPIVASRRHLACGTCIAACRYIDAPRRRRRARAGT